MRARDEGGVRTRVRRTGRAAAVLMGGLIAIGVWIAPRPGGACPPSGGPSEVLALSLESVRVDGVRVDTIPYGVRVAGIEGVGPTLTLYMEVDGGRLRGAFVK